MVSGEGAVTIVSMIGAGMLLTPMILIGIQLLQAIWDLVAVMLWDKARDFR